jgi:hypothetical protein
MFNETMEQGYVLLYDPAHDSWLATRFDYLVFHNHAHAYANPTLHIEEWEPTKFELLPRIKGTKLTFVDRDGNPHELTGRHPGEGKMVCVETLTGPREALAMLLEER